MQGTAQYLQSTVGGNVSERICKRWKNSSPMTEIAGMEGRLTTQLVERGQGLWRSAGEESGSLGWVQWSPLCLAGPASDLHTGPAAHCASGLAPVVPKNTLRAANWSSQSSHKVCPLYVRSPSSPARGTFSSTQRVGRLTERVTIRESQHIISTVRRV